MRMHRDLRVASRTVMNSVSVRDALPLKVPSCLLTHRCANNALFDGLVSFKHTLCYMSCLLHMCLLACRHF